MHCKMNLIKEENNMNKYLIFFKHLLQHVWLLLLSGFFTILPIIITVGLITISLRVITRWITPLHRFLPTAISHIPYIEFVLIIAGLLLLGIIMRIFIFRSIIHAFEHLFSKIPLIRPVYLGIKQLVQAFSLQDKISFKKVVLIEFPRKEVYSIGFLTSELPQELAPSNEKFVNIFLPTTPNPTSGYFIIIPEKDIKIINITRQAAMAMIISGGIIQPEQFQ